ncbi:hypothetical protein VM1G_00635 [Cytospora mali]|uniref:Uncharacterized protein n=1 Tax=Cytospora mali TaxID=578113 RepID=A0A194VKR2_CYTMA|nr:hypothetical protein VM1G_00635 [Valsa mali]
MLVSEFCTDSITAHKIKHPMCPGCSRLDGTLFDPIHALTVKDGKTGTEGVMTRQSRAKGRRLRVWTIVAMVSTASAISLNDLQPLQSGSLPTTCGIAYNETIIGCTSADFASGSHCSQLCEMGLEIIEQVIEDCDGDVYHNDSDRIDDRVFKKYRLVHDKFHVNLHNVDFCINIGFDHTLYFFDTINSYSYDHFNDTTLNLLDDIGGINVIVIHADHFTNTVPVVEHVRADYYTGTVIEHVVFNTDGRDGIRVNID